MNNRNLKQHREQSSTNCHADHADRNAEQDEPTGANNKPACSKLGILTACVLAIVTVLEEYQPDWRWQVIRFANENEASVLVMFTVFALCAFIEPEHDAKRWIKIAAWLGETAMTAVFGFMLFLVLIGPVLVSESNKGNELATPPEKRFQIKSDLNNSRTPNPNPSLPIAPTLRRTS